MNLATARSEPGCAGGFGQLKDGSSFGCMFDGVSAGGRINAYAAQAFATYVLQHLALHGDQLLQDIGSGKGLCNALPAEELFAEAAHRDNNPGRACPEHNAEGGAATGCFVMLSTTDTALRFTGAALGDAAAIVINRTLGVAVQLNQVERLGGKASDSGGQLNMCMGLDGTTVGFDHHVPLDADVLLLLCTDGLTDNVHPDAFTNLIPYVMECSAFDSPRDGRSQHQMNGLPSSVQQLREWLQQDGAPGEQQQRAARATPAMAASRLINYVRWVTSACAQEESSYYQLLGSKRDNCAVLEELELYMQTAVYCSAGQALQASTQERQLSAIKAIKEIDNKLGRMRSERQTARGAAKGCKTDDCGLLVLKPSANRVLGWSEWPGEIRRRAQSITMPSRDSRDSGIFSRDTLDFTDK